MTRTTPFLFLPLLLTACDSQKAPPPSELREIVEVLQHDEGSFTRSQVIPTGEVGSAFTVNDVSFTIIHLWPHAETTRKTTDDAEVESHAIELSWNEGDTERTQWVYQTRSTEETPVLEAAGAKIRVTAPGARPPVAGDPSFRGQVQFLWKGHHFDLPETGGEVFEGWTIKSLKTYQHALMDEEGGVTEAEDASFTNRVLEVHLTDGKGSEERHITFLDHPDLTKGIHPTILPVSRVSGEGASLSRLVVCDAVEPAPDHEVVQIAPGTAGQGLKVRVWPKGDAEFRTIAVQELPAEIPLAEDRTLRLDRHFTRARPHVKWERREVPEDGGAKPALVIEHRAGHHQKTEFVLIRDEVTPCRIGDKHLMLRYKIAE